MVTKNISTKEVMMREVKYEIIDSDKSWEGAQLAEMIEQGYEIMHAIAVDRSVHYILSRDITDPIIQEPGPKDPDASPIPDDDDIITLDDIPF